jgi:hypothetical protein
MTRADEPVRLVVLGGADAPVCEGDFCDLGAAVTVPGSAGPDPGPVAGAGEQGDQSADDHGDDRVA